MYKQVSTSLDFVKREEEVMEFWQQNDIFKKCMELNKDQETFTFYDGPPTANGKPHVGHLITRAFKDIYPRYHTMKGRYVLRKAGWDTHGLPVELEVEKALGIDSKTEIEAYGIEKFIEKCKESVWVYKEQWEKMSERIGFWADMENPYVTYENDYIESIWWSLKKISEKGLLYKGHKVVPYCPRCGTSLSSHEVAQGYKDVTDTSAYVKFPVKGEENTYLLAWTTTPWTLPSNVALTVNAKEDYATVLCHDETYIMAKALLDDVLGEGHYEIKSVCKGADLVGMDYERLFDFAGETNERGWYVVADDYVTLTDGTGIVHCAPAFGEDDARVGRKYELPFVQLVNGEGNFIPGTGFIEGMFVKDADAPILENLKSSGLSLKTEDFDHSYPFCWRCDTPLIYYATDTWFIAMSKVKDLLVENNLSINWMPDNIKHGRMGKFVENVLDWGLSRSRYWGTPLPVWECGCGHFHTIGSIAELKERCSGVPDDIELHRPYVDVLTMECEKCGGEMRRVLDVIDCWYDSGAMPFAQWHYPFENKELFEKHFPAQFISEAMDQTRGWFYTMLAISTLLFEKSSYESCLVLGLVADKDGRKMSKHLGNGIDPWDALNAQGADAVRWYFYVGSAPWMPSRFSFEAVSEAQRKYMGTLWNTYAFFVLYANIDRFDATKHSLDHSKLGLMDRWVLSRLNTLVKQVDENMEKYNATDSARAMNNFVDELSNWYVRTGRERFWAGGMEQDKINAYMTLYTVLVTMAKLTAPFTPFMAEQMYRNLVCQIDNNALESVHFCSFPQADTALIDEALEKDMDVVLRAVSLGRAARNNASIKNRQPLSMMYISGTQDLPEGYLDIIKGELNVKDVRFISDARAFTTYNVKPQLRTVGPKYGKQVGAIGRYLGEADGNDVVDALDEKGAFEFELGGVSISLTRDDLLLEKTQKAGFMAESDRDMTVILDTNLSPALIDEGYVRELVSKIQTMRKEAGFNVMDRIQVCISAGDELSSVAKAAAGEIMGDVMALSLDTGAADQSGYVKKWDINGLEAEISVKR
ncbi:MAG: isoleucine--tRNA ligase [Christensenellales bacterium]|jgi:isoleucyl-tRNA synthetase